MHFRGRPDVTPYVGQVDACRAESLTKVYGRRDTAVRALREITLGIPDRAFTAIMGPSGSGKSTLLHCLAALDTPTSGRVFLGHTELTALSRRQQAQVRRDRVGFVFQAFNLVPTLNALENITLPQQLAGRRPDRGWLDYVIRTMGLAERLSHRPSELSGGQQQRVALARALVGRPEVIFADEPTGNLDTTASREMLTLLRNAVDEFGQTVVTVTHDPMIASYADQVLFFSDGQVVDHVVRPETHEVQKHLQYLDTASSWHDRQQVQPQADGQQDMRSRRRRRTEDTGPGRPMVGSDDEVEVARQERWLQRIREQFDVEIQAGQSDNGADVRTRHAPTATADTNIVHPASVDDEGWLPPEQSWTSGSAAPRWQPDLDVGAPARQWEPAYDASSADAADEHVSWQRDDSTVWQPSTPPHADDTTTQDRGWRDAQPQHDPQPEPDPQPEYDEWSPTQPRAGDRPSSDRPVPPSSSQPVYAEWEGWPPQPNETSRTMTARNGRRSSDTDPGAPTGGWQVGDDEGSRNERQTLNSRDDHRLPPSAGPAQRADAAWNDRAWRDDAGWRTDDLDDSEWQPANDRNGGAPSATSQNAPRPASSDDVWEGAERRTDDWPGGYPADDVWGAVGQHEEQVHDAWTDREGRPAADVDRAGLRSDASENAPSVVDDVHTAPDRVLRNGETGAPRSPGSAVPYVESAPPGPSNGSALDALQSLQAQLDRLGGSGRRARSGGRSPRGDGPAERDPDRNGRH